MDSPNELLDSDEPIHVEVRNVGGIDSATVEFGPGLTVLSGRNATNRTSFLRALMAALGSTVEPLKADADRGEVQLSVGGHSFTRTFERTSSGDIVTSGDPYLDDPAVADLFAFLLGDNEARRAAERGSDLRQIILRPVDTEHIEDEINQFRDERQSIDDELAEITELKQKQQQFVEELQRKESREAELREELADTETPESKIEENIEARDQLNSLLEALREKRSTLNDTKFELTTARESLEDLRSQKEQLRHELKELEDVSEDRLNVLDDQISRLRTRRSSLETEITRIGTVREFNASMLDENSDLLADDRDVSDPTPELLGEGSVTCWTCGTSVEVESIRTTLEILESQREGKIQTRSTINDELDSLEDERREIEQERRRSDEIETKLDTIETRIKAQNEHIEELEDKHEDLATEVDDLETKVSNLEEHDYDELIEEHKRANELEFELDRLGMEKERIEENIDELENQISREDELETQREHIAQQLEELRMRVERIEREAVDAFNDHMEALLDLLAYENIDRVWIERRTTETSDDTASTFDLHVVRSTAEGTSYQDSINHLSESEREVIGLVFALSGYLVHSVHEQVPVILLDSVEVIDAQRISTLVNYFSSFAESLVVALLPEDAAAIDDNAERITSID